MARMVKHETASPLEIKIGGESRWICRCGLTGTPPFCSGAHKQAAGEDPGRLYIYENGRRREVKIADA